MMKENQMKNEITGGGSAKKNQAGGSAVPVISTILLLLPWTILPLRTFRWALETPAAQIIIIFYAVLMIFTGIFTVCCYRRGRHKGLWMQLCTVGGVIYAAADVFLLGLMIYSQF